MSHVCDISVTFCVNAACRQGLSTRYYRMPRLLCELVTTRGDGSYPRFLGHLAKFNLLILDDWRFAPLGPVRD